MSYPICHSDPFSTNDATATHTVGGLYTNGDGNVYRYDKFLDAVTYKRGQVVCPASATLSSQTNDRSGGTGIGSGLEASGVVCYPVTANYFGFSQVAGIALVIGDGSVAAGDFVVAHTVDGEADTMADGEEEQVFGVALDADSTSNDPLGTSTMFHCRLRGLI